MNEWTTEQLRDLALLMPDQVRVDEAGRIVPLATREEVRHLMEPLPVLLRRGLARHWPARRGGCSAVGALPVDVQGSEELIGRDAGERRVLGQRGRGGKPRGPLCLTDPGSMT
jgi:hypothetical protein